MLLRQFDVAKNPKGETDTEAVQSIIRRSQPMKRVNNKQSDTTRILKKDPRQLRTSPNYSNRNRVTGRGGVRDCKPTEKERRPHRLDLDGHARYRTRCSVSPIIHTS